MLLVAKRVGGKQPNLAFVRWFDSGLGPVPRCRGVPAALSRTGPLFLMNTMSVLLVDGSTDAFSALSALEGAGMEVRHQPDLDGALELALSGEFDSAIIELRPGTQSGLKLVAELRERRPRLPVIVLSSEASGDIAIRAVRHGAFDVLSKPVDPKELVHVVEDAVATVRRSSKPVDIGGGEAGPDQIIGRSRAMTRVYRELAKLAATPVTVLIRGETGTGKELVARALYQHGHRAHKT